MTFEELAERIASGSEDRRLIAIAGAPGSGKSTLAEALVERLNSEAPESAAILPMDGYHYDDAILNARSWRSRKGAPHTFDVAGFAAMLRRMARNEDDAIAVPVFDRSLELSRNAARLVSSKARRIIVEGNYLLLDEAPWTDLQTHFDLTVFVDVSEDELRRRLENRWRELPPELRAAKVEENDLPNARLVIERRCASDITVTEIELPGL